MSRHYVISGDGASLPSLVPPVEPEEPRAPPCGAPPYAHTSSKRNSKKENPGADGAPGSSFRAGTTAGRKRSPQWMTEAIPTELIHGYDPRSVSPRSNLVLIARERAGTFVGAVPRTIHLGAQLRGRKWIRNPKTINPPTST